MDYQPVLKVMKSTFRTAKTLDLSYRKSQLRALLRLLKSEEKALCDAVYDDFKKPRFECFLSEIALAQSEASNALNNLDSWAKSVSQSGNVLSMNYSATTEPEPFGVVLCIGAWNYPIQLTFNPLIAAIAAGNCFVLKPSEHAPTTSKLLATLFPKYLDSDCYKVIEGGIPETTALLGLKWDMIFYTGSPAVGKIVYAAAAQHLTPVILELGGSNPVYVDDTANLHTAARRICWGKFQNCGQICMSPNYIMCSTKEVHDALIKECSNAITEFYSEDPEKSLSYGRMVHKGAYERVSKLLHQSKDKLVFGGQTNASENFIAPTLFGNCSTDDAICRDEIFGPLLPFQVIGGVDNAIERINDGDKPLACYVFTGDAKVFDRFRRFTSSGSISQNETLMSAAHPNLPFGGVGKSGVGSYHGKFGFDAFSHSKAVLKSPQGLEEHINVVRYPPYTTEKRETVRAIVDSENPPNEWSVKRGFLYPFILTRFVGSLLTMKKPVKEGEKC